MQPRPLPAGSGARGREGGVAIRRRARSAGIFGLGADLCPVARIEKSLPRIARRAFTPGELREAARRAHPAEFLAGRWAAKEALLKALATGIAGVAPMNEIEITGGERGEPRAVLSPAAAARLRRRGAGTIHLSISHDHDLAVAVCVIERA